MFDASLLLSFLDDWLASESVATKEKFRLDQTLLADVSSLAALYELLATVRQFRPVCTPIDIDQAKARYGTLSLEKIERPGCFQARSGTHKCHG